MKDTLQMIDSTVSRVSHVDNSVSVWLWIALIEFVLIVWFLAKLRKQKQLDLSDVQKSDLKQSGDINMNNLMNSIHHSRELYKELSKKCHPDRFVNTPEQEIAEEIFQRISESKRNYEQLMLIKEEAKNKLNINFQILII